MNKSRSLADGMFLRRHGRPMPRNEVLDIVFEIIDTFNHQHWHDRNRYEERIKKLEKASERE